MSGEPVTDPASRSFGTDAAAYDRHRFGYPARVFEILTRSCGLARGAHLFEIGAGTGIATLALLEYRPAALHAIEPDARMLAALETKLPAAAPVTIHAAPFEAAALAEGRFDLGVAATAFHWLDTRPALAKIRRLLRPGGHWAMWWNVHRDPSGADAFSEAVDPVYPSGQEGGARANSQRLNQRDWADDLEAAGFEDIASERIPWTVTQTAAALRNLYATYSDVRLMDPPARETFLAQVERIANAQFGGAVRRTYFTLAVTARSR